MTRPQHQKSLIFLVLASSLLVVGCSDSNNSALSAGTSTTAAPETVVVDSGSPVTDISADTVNVAATDTVTNNVPAGTDTVAENTDVVTNTNDTVLTGDSDEPVATVDNTNGAEAEIPAETQTVVSEATQTVVSEETQTVVSEETQTTTSTLPLNNTGLVPAIISGADTTGSLDDSPTATESASTLLSFLKDANRSAGPPSVPEGLTAILTGENFIEMSWQPSTDDQSVEAYEIYRDGVLIQTVRFDSPNPIYLRWQTTSWMDCDFTRYNCDVNPIVPGSSYSYQIAAIDNEGMKSALSEPMIFQMAQGESGGPDLTGYVPVFDDEFEGDSLDRDLWKTSMPWGPDQIVNRERQYFNNLFGSDPLEVNPFSFTGTTLKITGSVTPPELLADANNQPYISGLLSTQDKFRLTYGYVEMRAKVASGTSLLSTFFLLHHDSHKNRPEIDILEYNSSLPTSPFQTYHYKDSNRNRFADGENHPTPTMSVTTGDLSTGFHTYSVLWEPELVIWYIDGAEVQRIEGVRVSDEPMNIIAQLVIGSEWIGEPNASELPRSYEIDYIKAWQKQ